MTPTQNLVCASAALVALGVLFALAHHLYRALKRERRLNRLNAETIDHLASLFDSVKANSQDIKTDPNIQKLASEALAYVEAHRRHRHKISPRADLLIKDLGEMAGNLGPRESPATAWAAQSARQY